MSLFSMHGPLFSCSWGQKLASKELRVQIHKKICHMYKKAFIMVKPSIANNTLVYVMHACDVEELYHIYDCELV